MTKTVARNSAQLHARARYLDTAIKHFDLSFGLKEADELSNSGDEANDLVNPGDDDSKHFDSVAFWDHPITGLEAHILHAFAQCALAKKQGLPFPSADCLYQDLPGLGQTAVRVMLLEDGRPDPSDWLIEVENLEDVQSHYLCGLDPRVPHEIWLGGWLSSAEIRKAKKERLVEGGPEVYTIPFQKLHQLEAYDNVHQD
jgi:hypothetical protein